MLIKELSDVPEHCNLCFLKVRIKELSDVPKHCNLCYYEGADKGAG